MSQLVFSKGTLQDYKVMSERTKEVPQLADATYADTLVIKSTHWPPWPPWGVAQEIAQEAYIYR